MKIQFKHWKSIHSYVGLALAVFFLIIGLTGFLMIDDKMFGIKDQPVTLAPLLSWYNSMEEEKKDYKDREVVTLFTKEGTPIRIASDHGAILIEENADRWVKAKESSLGFAVTKEMFAKTELPHMQKHEEKPLHWGKIIDDLHTGKFFGGWLNLFYYLTAFSMLGLTLSGIYLWYKPWSQKRKRAKTNAALKKPIHKRKTAFSPGISVENESNPESGLDINSQKS